MSKSKYSIDSILEDIVKENDYEASGVAGFFNKHADFKTLFSYKLETNARKLTIKPTHYGLSLLKEKLSKFDNYRNLDIDSFIGNEDEDFGSICVSC